MGVLVECYSVVVPKATIGLHYPGELTQYELDCPNGTFCMDETLTRIGFMVPDDVKAYCMRLEALGFRYLASGHSHDFVVVDQRTGPVKPCTWLRLGRHPLGFAVAWTADGSPSPMYCPQGWKLENSQKIHYQSAEDIRDTLLPLANDEGTITYLDYKTGKQLYVGRALPPSGQG
jgi:hypothetical protein